MLSSTRILGKLTPTTPTKQGKMKDFKLLPTNLFGELLQCLYDSEVNFAIDWTWDGGFGWEFTGLRKSASTKALAMKADHTNLTVVGGLILHEYSEQFDGLDSEGRPNEMYHFLSRNGFLDMQYKWFQGGGFLIRYEDRGFELLEVPAYGGEAQSIGFFTTHIAAKEYADMLA